MVQILLNPNPKLWRWRTLITELREIWGRSEHRNSKQTQITHLIKCSITFDVNTNPAVTATAVPERTISNQTEQNKKEKNVSGKSCCSSGNDGICECNRVRDNSVFHRSLHLNASPRRLLTGRRSWFYWVSGCILADGRLRSKHIKANVSRINESRRSS